MNWLLTLSSLAIMVRPAVTWQYISPDALPSDSLSESCKAALVVELNCASQVVSFFEREAVPLESLQEACTSACGTSLANFEASLKRECSEEDVVEYESGPSMQFLIRSFIDLYLAVLVNRPPATTNPAARSCSGDVYTVKAGDDCRSISKANSVATSWMLYDNGLQAFCNDFPAAGQKICIVNKCRTYTIKVGDTCQSIAAAAKISMVQLYTWNPTLGESCNRLSLSLSHTICLEPHDDADYKPITRTATTKVPEATSAPVPLDIAEGTNKRCAQFYSVQIGDYCNQIVLKFSIPLQDFLFLNQKVNKECTNLLAKVSYCVSPVGPINIYPGHPDYVDPVTAIPNVKLDDLPKASFTAPSITDLPTEKPKAKDTQMDCYVYLEGDELQVDMSWSFSFSACAEIANVWGIKLEELQHWNPSLNTTSPDCAFKKAYAYCMGAYLQHNTGFPQTDEPPRSETKKPTTTSTPSNGISTPMPIQSGMGIADYHKISISDFFKWNPDVKSDCSNLSLGANACAGVIGSTSQAVSAKPSTTTTSNGISTPPAIQSGMVSDCNKFHAIKTTTTCQGTVDYDKITMANLLKWNPGIDAKCSNLRLGSSVCVGVIEGSASQSTPTKTAGGIVTPSPIQAGMIDGCTKFHPVKSTTTC
ncbi:unnamed protein product [Fusarium langsethiae]|nr:unnamed protein product [Fusarium langsethiae]